MPRKRKWIDRKAMKELAMCQLTNEEMARILKVSPDTLERRYAGALKEWKKQGVGSMRRRLYETAMGNSKGAITAMIFFLKNFGGMADQVQTNERPKDLGFGGLPVPDSEPRRVN